MFTGGQTHEEWLWDGGAAPAPAAAVNGTLCWFYANVIFSPGILIN